MEKNKKLEEQLNMLLKGYFIPIIGCLVIIGVIIFIYIPNVTGIISGISTLQSDNSTYNQYKGQIEYFKNLSSTNNQIKLTDNILAVNVVLPDEARTADGIITIQNLALQDGVRVTSIVSTLFDDKTFQSAVTMDPHLKVAQIAFHGSGTSGQAEKLLTDINQMKEVASVSDVTINGLLGANGSDDISFNCQIYSLDTIEVTNSINMLNSLKTNYTVDYLNTL